MAELEDDDATLPAGSPGWMHAVVGKPVAELPERLREQVEKAEIHVHFGLAQDVRHCEDELAKLNADQKKLTFRDFDETRRWLENKLDMLRTWQHKVADASDAERVMALARVIAARKSGTVVAPVASASSSSAAPTKTAEQRQEAPSPPTESDVEREQLAPEPVAPAAEPGAPVEPPPPISSGKPPLRRPWSRSGLDFRPGDRILAERIIKGVTDAKGNPLNDWEACLQLAPEAEGKGNHESKRKRLSKIVKLIRLDGTGSSDA